ncbi:t-SNARE coiled-coil domain [Carpediemonas membranifera]|uniref:t-SNARE coiled-coil domain n=1 Tax=Carpediemonas membranifera TaxID=201153 RepID=A0A8J6AZZ3_9EUKA|nr:t-SNARE coiled-coil domain [Carpediemonas membranifera]|eukprot:KAG9396365.1 t-SNARE coiled-coil domain [Carpediemonas membranifera]
MSAVRPEDVSELVLSTLQEEIDELQHHGGLSSFIDICNKNDAQQRMNMPTRYDGLISSIKDKMRDASLIRNTLKDTAGQVDPSFSKACHERLSHLEAVLADMEKDVNQKYADYKAVVEKTLAQKKDDLFGDIERERKRREIENTIQAHSMVEREQDDELDRLEPTLQRIKAGHEDIGAYLQKQNDDMDEFHMEMDATRRRMKAVEKTVVSVLKHVKKGKEAIIIIVLVLIIVLLVLLNIYGV